MINWVLYLAMLYMVARGAAQRPEWVLLAAAFFVPLTQALPFPVGTIGASANILVGCLLLAWIRTKNQHPEQPSIPLRGLIIGMCLFILWGAAHRYQLEVVQGQIFRNDMEMVYGETKEWMMSYVAYFLVFLLVDSRETLRKMWLAGMVCAGGECTLAVYERLQGTGRATAHLDEPNRAGAYFAMAFAWFLAVALIHSGRMRKLAVGGTVMALAAVFASLSRGAMLAAGVGALLVLGFFYFRVREGASKLGVAVLILLAVINSSLLLPERVVDRVLMTFGGGSSTSRELGLNEEVDQSSGERLAIWSAAYTIMMENPGGIGFYTFPTVVVKYIPLAKVAHNIYLTVGTELGVAALIWLLLLVGAVWGKCLRAFNEARGTDERALGLGMLGAWTTLVTAVCFINPLFAFNLSGQFWILFAARMKVLLLDEQEAAESEWRRWHAARHQGAGGLPVAARVEVHGR